MKENEVVEVLEDGTIYYFDLEVCNREAESLINELFEKEKTVPNFDVPATVFNLFINSIHILNECGWTTEDLIAEVLNHTQD